jgi:hypothetical protein
MTRARTRRVASCRRTSLAGLGACPGPSSPERWRLGTPGAQAFFVSLPSTLRIAIDDSGED